MKKVKKVLIILLVVILLLIGGVFMSKQPIKGLFTKNNTSGIKHLGYSYDGTIGADNYSINVVEKDGKYVLEYQTMEFSEYGLMTTELDQQFMKKLEEICYENKICKWNGFKGYAKHVLDGSGFSLSADFNDGISIRCSGMNSFPKGYRDFMVAFNDLFKSKIEEMKQQKRLEMIEKGIDDKLDSVIFNIRQQGTFGKDSFDIFFMSEKYRDNNIDIKIINTDEDLFPVGEFRYYGKMKDEDIHFEKFQELIDKYSLINWFNYEAYAEDKYNNEWFQVAFGFEKDSRLNACGSVHPENYDQFKKDFLKQLKEMIDRGLETGDITTK